MNNFITLDDQYFKSYIINTNHIVSIERPRKTKPFNSIVKLVDGRVIFAIQSPTTIKGSIESV